RQLIGTPVKEVIDLANLEQGVGLALIKRIGVVEHLTYAEKFLEFELLRQIRDARMTGDQFFGRTSNRFPFKYKFSLFGLDKSGDSLQQSALPCPGFPCNRKLFLLALRKCHGLQRQIDCTSYRELLDAQ